MMNDWDLALSWDVPANAGGEQRDLLVQPFGWVAGNIVAPPLFDVVRVNDVRESTNIVECGEQRGIVEQADLGGQAEAKAEWPLSDFDLSSLSSSSSLSSNRYRYSTMSNTTYTGNDRCSFCIRTGVASCVVPDSGRQVRCAGCMASTGNAKCSKARSSFSLARCFGRS
jgi:hypothetical protein